MLVGVNDTATSTDTITIVDSTKIDGGTQVTYESNVEMKGAAKLASPMVKLVFEHLGNETEDQMVSVLNRLPT